MAVELDSFAVRLLVSDGSRIECDKVALELGAPAGEAETGPCDEAGVDAVVVDVDLPPGAGTVHVGIEAFPGGRILVAGLAPDAGDERCVVERDGGQATVRFGDGRAGGLPAQGEENVRAAYRVGGGAAGNVPAGRLTVSYERPLSIEAVANPVPTAGGADPESFEEAVRTAPRSVRVLERAVTEADFENVAAGFPGVAVSRASVLPASRPCLRVVEIEIGLVQEPVFPRHLQ